MKLIAHVGMNGQIHGLVAIQDGVTNAGLLPQPGTEVCQVEGHPFEDKSIELETLSQLLEEHTVDLTPARGKLVPRQK